MSQQTTPAAPPKFPWPDGKIAAISISFDDTRPSQLDAGLPILNRHDVKATFYATLRSLELRQEDWRAAAESGHEIANHTTSHACTGNFPWSSRRALESFTLDEMEKDILDASDALKQLVGVTPTTFAYPCGQSYVGRGEKLQSYIPLIAKHFTAGRGWMCESIADPSFCDLAYVPAVRLDNTSWEDVQAVLKTACEQGRWVAFAGHDVGTNGKQSVIPEVLEQLCAWCKDESNNVWIDTIANVAEYVKPRQQF